MHYIIKKILVRPKKECVKTFHGGTSTRKGSVTKEQTLYTTLDIPKWIKWQNQQGIIAFSYAIELPLFILLLLCPAHLYDRHVFHGLLLVSHA